MRALGILLLATFALAQSPVTVTVDMKASSAPIPSDYLGLSFESSNMLPEPNGGHLFSAANKPLVELFRTLGVRSLRIGGGTADTPRYEIPGEKDIDELFAFASAADVKVIYTLRLPRADAARNAAIAKYIYQHYAPELTCLEIGNEPDYYRRVFHELQDYASYRVAWKAIADAVMKAAPNARFCGPAAGGITAWSRNFAEDFGPTGKIAAIVMHEYTGGDGGLISGAPARDAMLSRQWPEFYDRLYTSFAVTAQAHKLPYRLEETNNVTGGAKDATDTFPASLWALEYLHWWAVHGAAGMNFHNRRWILNTTIYPVKNENDGLGSGYLMHPIGYGLKAFDIGAHGTALPAKVISPDAVNLTAYAVRDRDSLFVTIMNKKDPGSEPHETAVTIVADGVSAPEAAMYLRSPGNDVGAKEGIELGGSAIRDGHWEGKWTPLHDATIKVPGGSAAIIRLPLERKR